jgi:hypothetical protein
VKEGQATATDPTSRWHTRVGYEQRPRIFRLKCEECRVQWTLPSGALTGGTICPRPGKNCKAGWSVASST